MKKLTLARYFITVAIAFVVFIFSAASAEAVSVFITTQGGTGTTSPSGILYGDNGATNHLNTATIGSGLTFSGGTLSASGGTNYFTLTGSNLQNNVGNALGINTAPTIAALEVQASSTTGNIFTGWSTTGQNQFSVLNNGNVGISSSSPWGELAIHAQAGTTYPGDNLFVVGSSTASATSTLLNLTNTGHLYVGVPRNVIDAQELLTVAGANYGIFSINGTNANSDVGFAFNQGAASGPAGNGFAVFGVVGTQTDVGYGLNTSTTGLPSGTPVFLDYYGSAFHNVWSVPIGTNTMVLGGSLGVGSSTPAAETSIHAVAGVTYPNNWLFAIGSSTASATTTLLSLDNTGFMKIFGGVQSTNGSFIVPGGNSYQFNGRTTINSPADGKLELQTNGGGSFTSLNLGGNTSSFPAIGVSGSNLIIESADGTFNTSLGIGTSTPGSILSVQGVANFTTATTTFYGNGINIPANQCYAVNGVCIGSGAGGSGTVTSIIAGTGLSGGTITTSGTIAVNTTQNITTLSNLTVAGFVQTTSGGLLSSAALTSGQVTTALGFTPISGNQTITLSGVTTGSGTTAITTSFGSFTSATLAAALTDGTGTGSAVFAGSPAFTGTITGASATLSGTLTLSALTGTQCLQEISGVVSGTGSACGSGGSSFAYPFTPSTDGTLVTSATSTALEDTVPGVAVDVSQFGAYGQGGRLLGYASTTNKDTIWGLQAGGQNATTSATSNGLTAIGFQALQNNTTGVGNVAVGALALNQNIASQQNTAVGFEASQNTIGNFNTSLGYTALMLNQGGTSNIAIGEAADNANTSGVANTIIGTGAADNNSGFSDDTCVGDNCLAFISSGTWNTAFGMNAGFNLSTGKDNILIGAASTTVNANLSTGSDNIVIGDNISLPLGTQNSTLDVANLIYGTAIGVKGLALSSGTFGVGTTSPSARFSVAANGGDTNLNVITVSSSTAAFATTTLFNISNTGAVQFGALGTGAGNGAACLSSAGVLTFDTGANCITSSERFKNQITDLSASSSLAEIMALKPVSFYYKNGYGDNGKSQWVGFIAEQVATVDKRLVQYDANGDGKPYSVYYQNFTALLAGAVQQLNTKQDAQQVEITQLQTEVAQLQQKNMCSVMP